jgi:hypothetical protein
LIVWLCVEIPFVVEEPFREETIDRFVEIKKVVSGISGVSFNVFIAVFHVFKLVRVFSGCKFSSGIEGYSCGRKIDIYRYPKMIWIERVGYETERFHS